MTPHAIEDIRDVAFSYSKNNYIKDNLHVLTIMKNLVFLNQIVEQGMQARFNFSRYFIKYKSRLVAQGCREGSVFILDTTVACCGLRVK